MADNQFASVYDRYKQNMAKPAAQQSSIVSALGAPDAPDGTPQVASAPKTAPKPAFNSVYDLYGQNKMNEFSRGQVAKPKSTQDKSSNPTVGDAPRPAVGDISIPPREMDTIEPEVPVGTDLPPIGGTPDVQAPTTDAQIGGQMPSMPSPPKLQEGEPPLDIPQSSGTQPQPEKTPSASGGKGGGGGSGGGGIGNNSGGKSFGEWPPKVDVGPPSTVGGWSSGGQYSTGEARDTRYTGGGGDFGDYAVVDPDTGEPLIDPNTGDFVMTNDNGTVSIDPDTFKPVGSSDSGGGPLYDPLTGLPNWWKNESDTADPYYDPVTGENYNPNKGDTSTDDYTYEDSDFDPETGEYRGDVGKQTGATEGASNSGSSGPAAPKPGDRRFTNGAFEEEYFGPRGFIPAGWYPAQSVMKLAGLE